MIEFFTAQEKEKPIFSAYTDKTTYRVSDFVLRKIFVPGESYSWRVQGLDEEENIASQSELWEFKFIEPDGYLPGQIIVAMKKGEEPEKIDWQLHEQYHLTVLENFELGSLLKINPPSCLSFGPSTALHPVAHIHKYALADAPCIRTKIRRIMADLFFSATLSNPEVAGIRSPYRRKRT